MWWLIVGLTALMAYLIGGWLERCRLELRRKRFASRKSMPLFEISSCFFPELAPRDVQIVWRKISSLLCIEPGLLRPSDRFDTELKFEAWWGDDEVSDVFEHLFEECRRKKVDYDRKLVFSIGDVVRLLCHSGTQQPAERAGC